MSEAVNTAEELEAQLPVPVGYRVLVALPQIEETFDGTDLLKTDTTKKAKGISIILCEDHRKGFKKGRNLKKGYYLSTVQL